MFYSRLLRKKNEKPDLNPPIKFRIKEGQLKDAAAVSSNIPEFDNPYPIAEYHKRLSDTPHLILTAYDNQKPVGFKIGYERNKDGSFYSWMGGVLPDYRKMNAASILADYQESWAKRQGYKTIRLKTRSKHRAMLSFSLKRKFMIKDRIPKNPPEESRIILVKSL